MARARRELGSGYAAGIQRPGQHSIALKRQTIWALALTSALAAHGCGQKTDHAQQRSEAEPAAKASYVLPPQGTRSLIQEVRASRDAVGGLLLEAKTLLPEGTKVHVEVSIEASKKEVRRSDGVTAGAGARLLTERVDADGILRAGPYNAPKAGKYCIAFSCYFNGAWQDEDVLALVGNDGLKLPRAALDPLDPEFPDAGGRLEYSGVVIVGGLPPDVVAIEAVKNAKLLVKGKGQAVDTVAQIVAFFDKPHIEFYPGSWSAKQNADGTWNVSLDHKWGNEAKVANWEFNPKTRGVRYLDPEAKMLSWIPAE